MKDMNDMLDFEVPAASHPARMTFVPYSPFPSTMRVARRDAFLAAQKDGHSDSVPLITLLLHTTFASPAQTSQIRPGRGSADHSTKMLRRRETWL